MPELRAGPLRRTCAAIVAFCYFWLSTVVACQHTHHLLDDMAAAMSVGYAARAHLTPHAAGSATQVVISSRPAASAHCFACEWQAASVSPALPAMALALTSPCAPRDVAPTPHCVSLPAPAGSSRAPPLA
ncbi:MAG TPA: hypothetical protein VKT77_02495 [Chthonomonadaceae bacterium]|nr:hypothetical protein [Chthonomonadaceae bacterium]